MWREGEPGFSGSRRPWQALHGALRGGERDVAQRVPQRASQGAGTETAITELKSTVAQQQKDFQAAAARQQKQIEALTAGLRKVSAELELSKAAPQMVVNDQ